MMNSSQFVTRLAFEYNEPLEISAGNKFLANVKLIELKDYLDTRYGDETDLSSLFNTMIKKFKPTSFCSFPNPEHIKRIETAQSTQGTLMSDVLAKYCERSGIKQDIPEEFKNITIEELLEDDEILKPKEMIEKYGIKLCGSVWYYQGEHDLVKENNEGYNRYERD